MHAAIAEVTAAVATETVWPPRLKNIYSLVLYRKRWLTLGPEAQQINQILLAVDFQTTFMR